MRIRSFAFVALFAFATPANADVQAGFSDGSVLEINEDGSIRGNLMSGGYWHLRAQGRDYLIVEDGGTQKVLDGRIVAQVAYETLPPMISQLLGSFPPMVLHPAGAHEVNGRTGTGYSVDDDPEIAFVVSDDPAIRDVGAALAAHYRAWTDMSGPMAPLMEPITDLVDRGTAIRIGNVDLMWIADGELDDSRFALPSAPLDRYETEELMRRKGMLETG